MAVSRMLKVQLLGHSAIKDDVKFYLREAGVVEITDVSLEAESLQEDGELSRDLEPKLEQAEAALDFLEAYTEQPSFFEKIGRGPLAVSNEQVEALSHEMPVGEINSRCIDLQATIRSSSDRLVRSAELVSSLTPWKELKIPLQDLSTEGYNVQFWTLQDKVADKHMDRLRAKFEFCECTEFCRENGKSYISTIIENGEYSNIQEAMKELGAGYHVFGHLSGTPAEIISRQAELCEGYRKDMEEAEEAARKLAEIRNDICILADYYREKIGLAEVDGRFYHTASTFILEGWVRALDRPKLERELSGRFDEVEISFRDPLEDEEPPVYLDNTALSRPYEFVTTLYGRPVYRELDPTPLLAPFFVLFFAMCLTDAGYGLSLAALAAFILMKFKPAGGVGLLVRLLFMGGIVTAVIGIIAGGIFGINVDSFPPWLHRFVFIDPLREPMKMLNISFVMGLVHMVFGMGIRFAANLKAHLYVDAIFDDLTWMLFLIALAPLGYAGILGGSVPAPVLNVAKWAAIGIAAVVFLTGGRREKSIIKKALNGLVKFYDVIGYFGDVLSYARLLALGLATSAIAIAVNDIAAMTRGLPFYTGYIVMVLVLIGGHTFNLAVNTLGAFVHSGRLQYLEFFSKFFTGGGRQFKPFRSERKFSMLKKTDNGL